MATKEERWWLGDAEALNRESPNSFFIPPKERRENLVRGDSAKLVFHFEPTAPDAGAERMWVDVVETDPYVGELLNQPRYIRSLKRGDLVAFEPKHVASIAVSADEAGYDIDAEAVVSRRIRDDGAWPHFVYRLPANLRDDESDSGWQLWAREDDDAYVADLDNLVLWSLGVDHRQVSGDHSALHFGC